MIDRSRRAFLQRTAAIAGAVPMVGCGGASGASDASTTEDPSGSAAPPSPEPAPSPVPAPSAPPPNSIGPFGVSVGAMQLSLRAAAKTPAAPFCLGYAFKAGEIPAGSGVTSNYGALQITPRNHWPDGSLKFAELAGIVDLPANSAVVITLRKAPLPSSTRALSLADLKATSVKAEIGCGSLGSVRWEGTNWDQPFQVWTSGPLMSSWIYRKSVGSDGHLVAWIEIRLFANGAVEALPWIENGYLHVATPSNKNAIFTFDFGATRRFSASIDLKHHQRTPLINGPELAYWLDADPGVAVHHDTVYLQETELVPAYLSKMPSTAAVVTRLPATFSPLQQGSFSFDGDNMASPGYQNPIGILPLHDMLYLVSNTGTEFGAVVRNGYSAGRYGIHYRDEATNRPPAFSQWPKLVIADGQGIKDNGASTASLYTAKASGGNPPSWDIAHSPSVGYMAYLLTGRFYFMEEVQFAATLNGFMMTDWVRAGGGSSGYRNASGYSGASCVFATSLDAFQTRSSAWGLRTLAQALCITPPIDPLYREFLASMEDNCRYFHQTYVAQPNNPFGMIAPGESYNGGTRELAVWQQDFVTAAWGYAMCMGLPLSTGAHERMSGFFKWKAKGTVFRLGVESGFWYVNANAYTAKVSGANNPDYIGGTGPWYSTEGQCYAATYPTVSPPMSSTEGILGFDFGTASDAAKGMWGNLQPAIAYATRLGVPGAREAYRRMTEASNWPALLDAFNARPVWSVRPATTPTPAWLKGKPTNQWFEIPNTEGPGAGLATNAYSDMTLRPSDNSLLVVAAGGHADGSSNAAAMLSLSDDAPAWVTLRESSLPMENALYYTDGRPTSRHTYHHTHYIADLNAVLLAGCRFGFGGGTPTGKGMDLFSLNSRDYLPRHTFADLPADAGYGVVQDGEGNIWTQAGYKFTVATANWSKPGSGSLLRYPAAYDLHRNRIFSLQWADGEGYGPPQVNAREFDPSSGNSRDITFKQSTGLKEFQAAKPSYAAMAYCPVNASFYFLHPGQMGSIYVIIPNEGTQWEIEIITPPGLIPISSGVLCKRLLWVSAFHGFVLQANSNRSLYFMRIENAV